VPHASTSPAGQLAWASGQHSNACRSHGEGQPAPGNRAGSTPGVKAHPLPTNYNASTCPALPSFGPPRVSIAMHVWKRRTHGPPGTLTILQRTARSKHLGWPVKVCSREDSSDRLTGCRGRGRGSGNSQGWAGAESEQTKSWHSACCPAATAAAAASQPPCSPLRSQQLSSSPSGCLTWCREYGCSSGG